MRTNIKGFTLIEVMLSLVIVSVTIALGAQLLSRGMEKPFVMERIEPWLTFMEDVNRAVQELPENHPLLKDKERADPFPDLSSGLGLKNFKLIWQDYEMSENCSNKACLLSAVDSPPTGSPQIKAALFSASVSAPKEKIISWRAYKIIRSESPD